MDKIDETEIIADIVKFENGKVFAEGVNVEKLIDAILDSNLNDEVAEYILAKLSGKYYFDDFMTGIVNYFGDKETLINYLNEE